MTGKATLKYNERDPSVFKACKEHRVMWRRDRLNESFRHGSINCSWQYPCMSLKCLTPLNIKFTHRETVNAGEFDVGHKEITRDWLQDLNKKLLFGCCEYQR